MASFALIAVCLGAGLLLSRLRVVPRETAAQGVLAWLVWVALPAFTLLRVPRLTWSSQLLLPAIAPALVFVLAIVVLGLASRSRPRSERAALILAGALCNTSFVGFPIVQAYYGEPGLELAIVSDQTSFVLLATAGVIVAARGSAEGKLALWGIALRVLRFPPFVAFVIALVAPRFVDLAPIAPLLETLAHTLIPLALFAIGLSLVTEGITRDLREITMILAYKLVLAPLAVLLAGLALGVSGLPLRVAVLEAAMATMASAVIVAGEQGLSVRVISLAVGVGIPASLLTTAGWWWLLERLG